MLSPVIQEALNKQINNEFFSSYSYLAMAGYCESEKFVGCAKWLRFQSQEENSHAMRLYDFLIARDGRVLLDDGVVQLWIVSPNGGSPRQVTRNDHDVASAFTWDPGGEFIAHVMDGAICTTMVQTGETIRLTQDTNPRPEACVVSPDGKMIALNKTNTRDDSDMLEKGLAKRDDSVRPQVYRAATTQSRTQKRMLNEMIQKVYDGSAKSLVLQALSSAKTSKRDLEEIRKLLDQLS